MGQEKKIAKIELTGDGSFKGTNILVNGKNMYRIKELHLDITADKQELTLVIMSGSLQGDMEIKLPILTEVIEQFGLEDLGLGE